MKNFQLLELCNRIYMPVLNDTMSACKITQFENLLRIWNKEKFWKKQKNCIYPFMQITYLRNLTWNSWSGASWETIYANC